MKLLCIVALLATAIAASSCGTNADPPICNDPALPYIAQLFPVPGATGVPPSAGVLIVAEPSPAANHFSMTLQAGKGAPIATVARSLPSPLPSPMATPPANATLYAFAVPALAAATTYQTTATYNGSWPRGAACPPPSLNLGSFTTR